MRLPPREKIQAIFSVHGARLKPNVLSISLHSETDEGVFLVSVFGQQFVDRYETWLEKVCKYRHQKVSARRFLKYFVAYGLGFITLEEFGNKNYKGGMSSEFTDWFWYQLCSGFVEF